MDIKLYTKKSGNDIYTDALLKRVYCSSAFAEFGEFKGAATIRSVNHSAVAAIYERNGVLLSCNIHPLRRGLTFTHYLSEGADIDESLMDSIKSLQRLLEIL